MNWKGILTVGLGTVATAVPQFLPFIPPPYNAVASAGIAMIGMLWHLFTPVPGTK